jgi:2-polyprenyl-3-methyl-5-hydroxy-6-metoxy-1,4-benzoquinol methylase
MVRLKNDLAGRDHWNGVWTDAELPVPIDHTDAHFRNYVNRALAAYFDRALATLPSAARLLEVGCARSQWLPYFARRYPLTVTGLDYSEPGCVAAREVLARAGVSADVIQTDLFDHPEETLGAFDAVLSFGVVEHVEDTAACIEAIARFARPGGIVVTTIPNMTGSVGLVQRVVNPAVFAIHLPLTATALAQAHRNAGLQVESSGYLLSTNFGVINLHGLPDSPRTRRIAAVVLQLTRLSKLAWMIEDRWRALPGTRAFAPYAACCARR